MAITRTPSARVEEGAGPLGRGFGAPLSPVTEHPRAARWSGNIALPESEPPAHVELDRLTCEEMSLSSPSGSEVGVVSTSGTPEVPAGGFHPGAATRGVRARAPPRVPTRRPRGPIGNTGSERDARREKESLARGMSVDSGLDLLGARQTAKPAGRLEGYAQLMPLVLGTLAKLRCVDATRVSGHPSRRQIFSATASPALLRERTPVGTKKERRRRRAARPGGTTLTDHPTFRLALRALEWTPALGSRDPGAWFRSHAHPLARDGPPAPLGADLAKVGRRLLVPARVPTPTRSADSEFTSGRSGAVDDVIASAVERARGFTPARAIAFAAALESRCWIAVDRLADDARVRARAPIPPDPFPSPRHALLRT